MIETKVIFANRQKNDLGEQELSRKASKIKAFSHL